MATYTWSQWRLYGSGWSTTYTASADVSVTRSYGSSTATLSITATMTTQSGDSNTLGWKCWIEIGGTWQSFDIASSGTHYENTTKTASQTYTISVGDSAGTLTGGIKFQICGFTGYTGEYSDTQTYSLAYGSKGPTELTSVTNRYYGSAASFTLSRKATNMRENITMVNGSTTLTIRTTSDSATTFTYTLNRSYTPTTAFPSSSTWTITISTYDGSTLIGTKTYTYSWEIANSDKSSYLPTLSTEPTCQAYNDVVSALGTDTAVAGYSKINVNAAKADVSLKYNATIASRVVTFSDGTTVSADTTTHYSGKIMSAGSITWTYTVTDSRGLSVTRNGSYTVISANAPVITATVYRGNSSGTAQDGGPYIFVTATALYDSLNGHNSLTLQANVDSGTYSNITGGTRATLKTNADASTTYTVHVKATDILQSTTNTYKVTASDLPFNVAIGGKGVGIGTKASSDNTLRVGYDTKFYGDIIKHDSIKNEDVDIMKTAELLVPYATEIVANKNLNTAEFVAIGRYYCPSYSTVVTLSNCPTGGEGFVMNVRNITSDYTDTVSRTWMYLVREIVTLGGNRYVQYCQTGGSPVTWSFGVWKRIVTNGEVLGSGKNLNDYDYSRAGIYELQSGMSNSPLTWGCLVVGGHLGSHQLAFNSNGIFVRSKTGSPLAWTGWKQAVTNIIEKDTYANTSVKRGALVARRQGNVVSINSADDAVGVTANTWVAYVQLGARYRPNETVYVPCANVGTSFSRWIRIAPDGWVYLFSTTAVGSASNFGFSTTYIVD